MIRIPLGTSTVSGMIAEAPPGTEVLLLEASLNYLEEKFLPWQLENAVEAGFDRLEPDSPSFATAKVGCDEHGGFRFGTVPDGRYFLTATAPGYLPAPWQEFRVQGSSVRGLNLRLERAGRVVFRTQDPEQKIQRALATQLQVWLRSTDEDQIKRSTWNLEETTIFEKVPPGAYLLQVALRREKKMVVVFELPANVEAGETCELLWPGG